MSYRFDFAFHYMGTYFNTSTDDPEVIELCVRWVEFMHSRLVIVKTPCACRCERVEHQPCAT